MDRQERELREDLLGRSLKAAFHAERAPEAWTREALAAPARKAAPVLMPRGESRLLVVLPHLLGVALLVGFVLAMAFRPDIRASLQSLMAPLFAGGSFDAAELEAGLSRRIPWILAMSPLLLVLAAQATRGFAFVRRLFF